MNWPNRKWEPGIIDGHGRQLWYSREVDGGDKLIRQDYEDAYEKRQEERRKAK